MTSVAGFPAMIGKIGSTPFSTLAENVVAYAPRRKPIALCIDNDGCVWLDRVDAATPAELVGVYTCKSDPDLIEDDLRCHANSMAC
jgi:hypothetical protein